MNAGHRYPDESADLPPDPSTGARIRRLTSSPAIHHHPFYYLPCMDDAMRHTVLVTHRFGAPQILLHRRDGAGLVQLTDLPDLGEWSVHPGHDGRHVYFVAGDRACRVCTQSARTEVLATLPDTVSASGMVGAAMGTTSLSRDDSTWAVPYPIPGGYRLAIIDTVGGRLDLIHEHSHIGHPEFHPDDPTLLRYAGSYRDRIRVIRTDGSGDRLVYQRRPVDAAGHYEWIVHEVWRPGSREIITVNWPRGCIGIDIDSGAVRPVCSVNAWHAAIDRAGRRLCADTSYPDRGLLLIDALAEAEPAPLCASASSNVGAHWDTAYCPYDDGPVQVYSPQWTHPHPSFAPDGRSVIFTSDRTGQAQVYEVTLPEPGYGP